MIEQHLIGFSLGHPDGRDFHCLKCVVGDAGWHEKRALAVVEFPELQTYHGTYNFVRALRVVKAGPFGSRLYAVDDEDVSDDVRVDAEATARHAGLLLVPSLPIPIRPDFLVCKMCNWTYQREFSTRDLEALSAATGKSLSEPETLGERASILGKVMDVIRGKRSN